eukprot:s1267_g21.t1
MHCELEAGTFLINCQRQTAAFFPCLRIQCAASGLNQAKPAQPEQPKRIWGHAFRSSIGARQPSKIGKLEDDESKAGVSGSQEGGKENMQMADDE